MSLLFTQIPETEFTYFFSRNNGNYLQTKEMATLKKSRGYDIYYVAIKNSQGNILFATLLTRAKIRIGYLFEIDGLPIQNLSEVFEVFINELTNFVKEHRGVSLTIIPDATYKIVTNSNAETILNTDLLSKFEQKKFTHNFLHSGYNVHGNPNWVYMKDLTDIPEEDVEQSYNKEARYSIKKANEFGVQIRTLSYEELPLFKTITMSTSLRKNFEDKSLEYYQTVYTSYNEQAKFLIAEINLNTYLANLKQTRNNLLTQVNLLQQQLKENAKSRKRKNKLRELSEEVSTFEKRILEANGWILEEKNETVSLACALFLTCPSETVYLFSGTREKFKKMYAPFLIQDKMIKESIKKKIPKYNFYGIQGVFDGSDGVLKFKQSFNGYALEKIGSFTLITSPFKFHIYNFIKKRLHR